MLKEDLRSSVATYTGPQGMSRSGIAFALAAPSVAYAASPVYFDIGGAVLILALYGAGALAVFGWLANGRSKYRWKLLAVVLYFILLPGYPFAEKAHLQYKQKRAEKQRLEERAEADGAFVRFCLENLKREQPLEACKRFRPLGPDEEQLVIK